MFEVLDDEELIARARRVPRHLPPRRAATSRSRTSHFGHGDGAPVLRGVSLHVPARRLARASSGPTGSGKSSLVQLLPRFYDPDRRRDPRSTGSTSRDLDIARRCARTVGLVFQEPFLFSGTVAENIAYGNPDISPETRRGVRDGSRRPTSSSRPCPRATRPSSASAA